MSGHTPGPWSLRISSKGYENKFQIQREDGDCLFSFGDSPFHDDAEADAHLIAAAPELLSIAERWAALDGGAWHVQRHANEKAELLADTAAVIAKATGEQP